MKVLHLTNKPVFPLVDGGCIAMHELLKNLLQLGFEVKNLTIATDKHPFSIDAFPEKLSRIILPEAVTVDTTVRAKEAFFSLFSKKSYNISRFYNAAFEQLITEELKSADYGLVILESAYLLPYLKAIRGVFGGKVILRAHNVEFRIWERLAAEEKSMAKRLFLKKLARDLKQYEIAVLKRTDGIACISDDDKKQLRALGIQVPVRTIPVSMAFAGETEQESKLPAENSFFFIGAMNWKPNEEAVESLLNDIFPKILQQLPDAKLHLAGSFMDKKLRSSGNITIHGKVDSVQAFMTSHGILLVPLKSGSGIRIKILEALSFGVPVISTSIGFEGIPVENEVHGLVADSAGEMVKAALRLAQDKEFAAQLGKNGQQMVRSTYNPENISKKLLEFIQSI